MRRSSAPARGPTKVAGDDCGACQSDSQSARCPGSSDALAMFPSNRSTTRRWGTLVSLRPVLRPRQVRTHQATAVRQHGPRVVNREGIPRQVPFGAQWHGLGTRCLRFAAPVTGAPRQTRFRSLARLSRMGLVTHRVPLKGFKKLPALHPPFPSCLAQ